MIYIKDALERKYNIHNAANILPRACVSESVSGLPSTFETFARVDLENLLNIRLVFLRKAPTISTKD